MKKQTDLPDTAEARAQQGKKIPVTATGGAVCTPDADGTRSQGRAEFGVSADARPLRVLMVGSEALPFAASGGLGDVLGTLPAALCAAEGDRLAVRAVMPLYAHVREAWGDALRFLGSFTVRLAWRQQYCGIFSLEQGGVTWYFLDNEYYFKRGELYGQPDDVERYAYFSMAVLEMMRELDWFPDVLHAHDWQSAMCVVYLRLRYAEDARYAGIRSVYTVHNIEYQGRCDGGALGDVLGLPETARPLLMQDGEINLTRGAIACCDRLTTVSRRYAEELCMPYFAHGLADVIRQAAGKTVGIINGIDPESYNPAAEGELAAPFSAEHPAGKAINKAALQRALGLTEDADVPLMAMVTRLVPHKGIDLVMRVLDELMAERQLQFVLLGAGEAEYADFFSAFSARWPGRAAAIIGFDRQLAKRIYAGADLFLMPSMCEPCGLAQMIACRYGTLPIVRATGGLLDTVVPVNPTTGEGYGVNFCDYNAHEMKKAVERALAYYADRTLWGTLICRAMSVDFSWHRAAARYAALYRALV